MKTLMITQMKFLLLIPAFFSLLIPAHAGIVDSSSIICKQFKMEVAYQTLVYGENQEKKELPFEPIDLKSSPLGSGKFRLTEMKISDRSQDTIRSVIFIYKEKGLLSNVEINIEGCLNSSKDTLFALLAYNMTKIKGTEVPDPPVEHSFMEFEEYATYIDGEDALNELLVKRLDSIPDLKNCNKMLYVSFIVDTLGNVPLVYFDESCGEEHDKAIKRIFSDLKFNPAKRKGKPISSNLRIYLELTKKED